MTGPLGNDHGASLVHDDHGACAGGFFIALKVRTTLSGKAGIADGAPGSG